MSEHGKISSTIADWIEGLRDPSQADDCLYELRLATTPGADRQVRAPLVVPHLVSAAIDPDVINRFDVPILIQQLAFGPTDGSLDWQELRNRQASDVEIACREAVVADRQRLRALLTDLDRAVAAAALCLLGRTGDGSAQLVEALADAVQSSDDRDRSNGWLTSVVTGQLPPRTAVPGIEVYSSPLARLGAAAAGLRFDQPSAGKDAVDELGSMLNVVLGDEFYRSAEFLWADEPRGVAASALSYTPVRLRDEANKVLLANLNSIGRYLGQYALAAYLRLNLGRTHQVSSPGELTTTEVSALEALLGPMTKWRNTEYSPDIIPLKEYGLPETAQELSAWLAR
jgi:hypothetical protein